jgi:hypothetical protein
VAAFVPQPVHITETPFNPYAGITPADPARVPAAPSLNVPARDLFPGRRPAPAPAVPEPAAPAEQPPPAADRPRRRPAPATTPRLGGAAGDIFRTLAAAPPPRDPADPPPDRHVPQET